MFALEVLVLGIIFVKTLFYLRVFEDYGRLVALIYGVREMVAPFLVVFLIAVYMFGIIF